MWSLGLCSLALCCNLLYKCWHLLQLQYYEIKKKVNGEAHLAPPGNGPTVKGQTKVQVFPGQEGRSEAVATLLAAIEIANHAEQ